MKKDYFKTLIEWIKKEKPSKDKLAKYKLKLCKKFGKKNIPTDIEIFLQASAEDAKKIRKYVETKPTRTGSGVAVVATMTKPFDCPHGSCIYCPGGMKSSFGDVPKSYTGKEPSTMRGIRNDYDPYRIIFNRLEQYIVLGHNPEKVDQIIMGGTFCSTPEKYQKDYVYYSFKAYNDFSKLFFKKGKLDIEKFKEFFELPGRVDDKKRVDRIKKKILKMKGKNVKILEKEQKLNENAAIRCIGLTIETRPDYGMRKHGLKLLEWGVTRIELGVQSVYDDVLEAVKRGHSAKDSIKSISELRDLGFKLNFHVMPGLPGKDGKRISRKKDIENIKEIFEDEDYKPDMLKIYPCMVMPGTKLQKNKKFSPLGTKEAVDIIVEGFKYVPEWCRVMRIQRDIPTYATAGGVDKTNLRQYVDKLAKEKGVKIKDIRAREVRRDKIKGKPKIVIKKYKANNGKEFFISVEADDKIMGFTRLRLVPRSLHPAITQNSSVIRELHVYGTAASIGESGKKKIQHQGVGKSLMKKAEEIAKNNGKDKMVVISGVGVRDYYRKLGYKKQGPYMVKKLSRRILT